MAQPLFDCDFMRIIGLFSFLVSLCVSAACPDENVSLPDILSSPLGKSSIIAVVKGTLGTAADQDGFLVSTLDVTQSYGLVIPAGKYFVKEANYWGADCIYYQEKARRPYDEDNNNPVYFALTRIHGHTLVTSENEDYGLFIKDKYVQYQRPSHALMRIDQNVFQQNIFRGIPKQYWK